MKWISVEYEMPRKGQRVLVYGQELGIISAVLHLNKGNRWMYTGVNRPMHSSNKITHWMDLPAPPSPKELKDISQQGEQC